MSNYIDLLNIYGTDYKVFAQGGTLSEPLVVSGGDGQSSIVGKISLNQTNYGQITDASSATLFGFITATQLTVGSPYYTTNIRGSAISFATRPTYNNSNLIIATDLSDYVTVGGSSLQTITGPKAFTGTVGNTQAAAGVYLGLDTNSTPNANIAICSANTAAYIDLCTPNIDYGFRIIKWNDTNNTSAQFTYGSEAGGGTITVPHTTGTMVMTVNNTAADVNGNVQLSIPTDSSIAQMGYVKNVDVPHYQSSLIFVATPLVNQSGKSLSTYTSSDVTISGYSAVKILKNNTKLSMDDAKNYMNAISGSIYVPQYSYDNPKYSTIIDQNGQIYKPQWDSTNGLLLYKVSGIWSNVKVDNVHQSSVNFSYSNGILTITPTA